jgi:plastocyanin
VLAEKPKEELVRSRWLSLFALVLALGMVAAACGNSSTPSSGAASNSTGNPSPSESESEGGTITINGDAANNHGEKTVTGDELEVELDDFYFEPTVIKGAAGSKVKLELDNEGSATHNFSIDDQNINQTIDSGKKADVTVTIPASGQVEFYCKFHKGSGMVGALEAS